MKPFLLSKTQAFLIVFFSIMSLGLSWGQTKTLAEKIAAREQLTDAPTMYITISAAEGKNLNSVLYKGSNPEYFDAKIQVIDNSAVGSAKHLESFTDDVKIKVRGNSTANTDKKPYRLKFGKDEKDAAGNVTKSHKHDLIGDGYSKRNWALLANFYDGSKIRNALNQKIGQLVGMDFCPGYKFVDLVINGEYRGSYQVSDHVEVGSHRIDVDEDTGWYIEASRNDMIEDPSANAGSLLMTIKNPEPANDAEKAELVASVEAFYNTFSQKAASHNPDLTSPTLGWRSVADEESAVAFYIGTNLTANYDGFMTVKMFRNADDPRIHFGPLWDMDLAYGHYGGSEPGKLVEDIENGNFRWYIKAFMSDPGFVKKVHDKWHALVDAGLVSTLKAEIDRLAAEVYQTQALDYDTKWTVRMQGMQGKYNSFEDAITYLKNFIDQHVPLVQAKIDKQYQDLDCANYVEPTPGGEDTPAVNNDALQEVGTGVYKFVGSAATFKEGTVLTITTTSASTTLSNYITQGTIWNTKKSITLTAADVTALAANSYTFYMNASGGEVKAVNVKVPVVTGLSEGISYNSGTLYTYVGDASSMSAGAQFKITLQGSNPFYKAYISSENSPLWVEWGYGAGPRNYSYTVTEAQANALKSNKYTINIIVYEGTCSSAEFIGSSTGSTTTPQHTLTLTALAGGTVSGAGTYDDGTVVLIKAIANSGYTFVKWSDDNTNPVRSVALSEDVTLEATFELESEAPVVRKQLTDVPTIYIDTTGDITSDWNDATTNTVTLTIFDSENKLNQGPEYTTSAVQIQYQGSGSADSKNSYRLKFGAKTKLLSSGKFKQWVLASNDDDPSMINNALTKELGDALGMPFTPGYQFVDLYVNNEYQGTYQVTDRIKAESGRALVSGGNKDNDWHVQFDAPSEIKENDNSVYVPNTDSTPYIVIKNPDPDDLTAEEITALKQTMSDWFTGTNSGANFFDNVEDYVAKDQLISWYIGMEILCSYKGLSSIEAYRSVNAVDQKLHMGPFWDSEKAFGNAPKHPIDMTDLETEDSYQGLITEYSDYKVMRKWLKKLWRQKWFAEGVIAKWNTLYGENKSTDLQNLLKTKATAIAGTLAQTQVKNAEKWDNSLGSYTSYTAAVGAISTYLDSRFPYLDAKFNELYEIAVADLGDVNVDGEVNRQDVTDLGKYIIKNYTGKFSKSAADVNEDSKISLADLAALVKKLKDK